jgi:hypothetical protein
MDGKKEKGMLHVGKKKKTKTYQNHEKLQGKYVLGEVFVEVFSVTRLDKIIKRPSSKTFAIGS